MYLNIVLQHFVCINITGNNSFLQFSAELRLPESMSIATKKQIVAELIEHLDMEKCKQTSTNCSA